MSPSNSAKRAMPKIPKPDEEAKAFFRSVVPEAPDVAIRPMFGNVSGFVNGNMFMGLFGNGLFIRLPEGERDEVMAAGGSSFEPMPGRPMTGYVMVPDAWRDDPKTLDSWIGRALAFGRTLPPKQKKSKNS